MARKGGAIFGALFTSRTLIVRNCIFNRCVSCKLHAGSDSLELYCASLLVLISRQIAEKEGPLSRRKS